MGDWRSWPLLLVAAVLLVSAGTRAVLVGGIGELSAALLSAGLMLLGAWVAVEVSRCYAGRSEEQDDGEDL